MRTQYDSLWSPFGGYEQSGIGRECGPVGLVSSPEAESIDGGDA